MFENIEENLLDDPEFKEDSVRELIISPMLARLGYMPSGSNRVARSKTLRNPFIRVGTSNHPVTTIPDYTFYINDKPVFVLDAKAPNVDVLGASHIQQAYSYAIHPEIRCDEFGLCNGKELTIFNTTQIEPILHLRFDEFEDRWEDIEKNLLPKYLSNPVLRKFAPDFGLALLRMGYGKFNKLSFIGMRLNLFAKIDDSLMTASSNTDLASSEYCVSVDFNPSLLPQIVSGLPDALGNRFLSALTRAPFQAAAELAIELDLTVRFGDLTRGQTEQFVPLIIEEIHAARFNPAEPEDSSSDIPPHVFKLRDHFKMKSNTST